MIQVENLSKAFSLSRQQRKEIGTNATTITAVNNISFNCQPGRIYSLLGPNGAGKTTTLRMMATILKPTGGNIKINGYDVVEEGVKVRSSIGFLTGSTGLYQRLTPNELTKYFADLYGVDKVVYEKRKDELYTLLDMHDFPKKESDNYQQG